MCNETSEYISTGRGTLPCPPGLLQQQALVTETCPQQASPQEQVGRAVEILSRTLCLFVISCAVLRFSPPSAVCWRCRVLASSTATLEERPAAAAVPGSTAGAVTSQLVGKKVLQLSHDHSAVPLLHPISHSLPFSASLHIYSQHSGPGAAAKPASNATTSRRLLGPDKQAENTLVELHYVISGRDRVAYTPHPCQGTFRRLPLRHSLASGAAPCSTVMTSCTVTVVSA